jgi:hypothetical protein
VQHSAKEALPSAMPKTLGKAEKTKAILDSFPALLSAGEDGTWQRIFQKKISLPSALQRDTRQTNFF